MNIGKVCNREVVVAPRDLSLLDAGILMRERNVGTVIVTEKEDGVRFPLGIVTDRDILMKVLSKGVALEKISVEDIMSAPLLTAKEKDDLSETIQKMNRKRVRRLPVVNGRGYLVGLISMDDILQVLANEMKEISSLSKIHCEREVHARP